MNPNHPLATLAISLVAALAILVLFVLPAEHGIDPLGTGEALGLNQLSRPQVDVVSTQSEPPRNDTVNVVLQPWESMEIKYALDAGGSLIYAWHASGPLVFELHGEPAAGPDGHAETWHTGASRADAGTAIVPFSGRHGWYFENRNLEAVTVQLSATGFFRQRIVYRDGFVNEFVVSDTAPEVH